jgi:hypothetical protein
MKYRYLSHGSQNQLDTVMARRHRCMAYGLIAQRVSHPWAKLKACASEANLKTKVTSTLRIIAGVAGQ